MSQENVKSKWMRTLPADALPSEAFDHWFMQQSKVELRGPANLAVSAWHAALEWASTRGVSMDGEPMGDPHPYDGGGVQSSHEWPDCPKVIAWCNLSLWQSGKAWPDDCFTEHDMSGQEGWVPVYAAGVAGSGKTTDGGM